MAFCINRSPYPKGGPCDEPDRSRLLAQGNWPQKSGGVLGIGAQETAKADDCSPFLCLQPVEMTPSAAQREH